MKPVSIVPEPPIMRLVILMSLFSLWLASAPEVAASERTDFYLEMQQREECAELGGTLDGNKCYIPDNPGGGTVAQVYAKNPTGCDVWFLIAHVPPGADTYTVDGWWKIEPTYWSGTGLNGDVGPILHDGSHALYYHALSDDGRDLNPSGDTVTFAYDGEEYDMIESDWGLIDGYYWVTVDAC
jgi:hypothetical protein